MWSGEDKAESRPLQPPALAHVAVSTGPRCIPGPGMILDRGLRDASGDQERLVCPATSSLPWSSPATPGAKQTQPFPAPGGAGSLSPSINSPGALASVTQGAEAQARQGSAGLEGVKPTGSAWAPAVASGRWRGFAGSLHWGLRRLLSGRSKAAWLPVMQPGPPTQAPRGRAGGGGQEQAGCSPDTDGQGGAALPDLVPSWGQQCTAGSVAWELGLHPG